MSTPSGPQDQPSFPPPSSDPAGSFPPPPAEATGSFPPPPPAPQYSPPPPQYAPGPPQYGQPQFGQPPMPPAGQVSAVAGGVYQDPTSGLVLPQGTTLASSGRRIGAFFLAIPLSIITLGIGYLIWGLIAWTKGTSPALQVLGMRVWRPETQQRAGFGYMALRDIVGRIVDGILSIITELISFIFMLSRPDRKTLHDPIAGTVVVHDPNKVLA
jgi:uncharacterized RDD family membrane protein YckC